MSTNITCNPSGVLKGRQLLQPSTQWIQNRYNNGGHLSTNLDRTNFMSGNYLGGRVNYGTAKNMDVNGLNQPVGVVPEVNGLTYKNNTTGLNYDSVNQGGTPTTHKLHDLDDPINREVTSMYNMSGFRDPRQIYPYNEMLYQFDNPPVGSEAFRRENARGKFHTLLN